MRYIINNLRVFFKSRNIIFILIIALAIGVYYNYLNSDSNKSYIVTDYSNSAASKRLLNKLNLIKEFNNINDNSIEIIIDKDFDEKLQRKRYEDLIYSKGEINPVVLEKINLKIIELINEENIILKINSKIKNYSFDEFINDKSKSISKDLLNVYSINSRYNQKNILILDIIIMCSIIVLSYFIAIDIIEQRNKNLIQRLKINGISNYVYYIEKLIKLIFSVYIFYIVFSFVVDYISFIKINIIISSALLFIYIIILNILKLDRNTFTLYYILLIIILLVIYILPGLSIGYLSPVEIVLN